MKKLTFISMAILSVAVLVLIFGCGTKEVQPEDGVDITPRKTVEEPKEMDSRITNVLNKAQDTDNYAYKKVKKDQTQPRHDQVVVYYTPEKQLLCHYRLQCLQIFN